MTHEVFNKLPKNERKVLIAKDVIAQILIKKYKPGEVYVRVTGIKREGEDASFLLREKKLKCEVCARGALFMSTVKFKNKLKVGELIRYGFDYDGKGYFPDTRGTSYLGTEFSKKEQMIIECIYENSDLGDISIKEFDKCISYRDNLLKVRSESKSKLNKKTYILIAICENIIKNNGNLVI